MTYQDRLKLMNELMKESETVVTTDSNSDITKSNNNTVSNPVKNDTEEGYINQLNKLYSKGSTDKEYYLKQVRIMKNNYPISYELIKNKLLMN